MRILIEAHHPAHIHFFKHPIRLWRQQGHQVLMVARDRGIMKDLLINYAWIHYVMPTKAGGNNAFPAGEFLMRQIKVAAAIRRFSPQVIASVMGSYTQIAALSGIPNIVFTDSEHQSFNHFIAHPFATRIFTPECFWKDLGKKQSRYKGYHELSFLHPRYFTPTKEVLRLVSGNPVERSYAIVRLSAWNTLHDAGKKGFEGPVLRRVIDLLSKKYRVLLVPEGELPADLEPLRLRINPASFHDVLAFASLVVSEGASTASEAACLGVPAVYINPSQLGYLKEQEDRYGLVSNFTSAQPALTKIEELTHDVGLLERCEHRRKQLVEDHVCVADLVTEEVERSGVNRKSALCV